jgi:hypothetical protein
LDSLYSFVARFLWQQWNNVTYKKSYFISIILNLREVKKV